MENVNVNKQRILLRFLNLNIQIQKGAVAVASLDFLWSPYCQIADRRIPSNDPRSVSES